MCLCVENIAYAELYGGIKENCDYWEGTKSFFYDLIYGVWILTIIKKTTSSFHHKSQILTPIPIHLFFPPLTIKVFPIQIKENLSTCTFYLFSIESSIFLQPKNMPS